MKEKKSLAKRLLKRWKLILFLSAIIAVIEFKPTVINKPALTGEQANIARNKAKMLAHGLLSSEDFVELELNKDEIMAISATLSHMFDNSRFVMGYSSYSVQAASSTEIHLGLTDIYLNIHCNIEIEQVGSDIDGCAIGDLPIPGFVVSGLSYAFLAILFDTEVAKTVDNLVSNMSVQNQLIKVAANKTVDFKERIKDTLDDATSIAKRAIQSNIPDPEIIQVYVDDIARQGKSNDLADYIKHSMQLASFRSIDSSPIVENRAAMWAWAISFGGSQFARLANITDYKTDYSVGLRGRGDLAQHFIYSAIIAELSNNQFSFNAGELKEILDSGKGGSGFSFADLLADNTGIEFAEITTKNRQSAVRAQQILAAMRDLDDFFPYIHDLPEGLSEAQFASLFGSAQSPQYQAFVDQMNQRIYRLPLFNEDDLQSTIVTAKPRLTHTDLGTWIKVDTHMHSQYSDGSHSIDELAAKANEFGCDAIAITDHGDGNLPTVLSDPYFDDIDRANFRYPNLTVMPGLEWNIPPFNGREHATVLLPQSNNQKRLLRRFRQNFDHYRNVSRELMSAESGLTWLNQISASSSAQAVVFYNHPSRKDLSSAENKSDIAFWQSISPTLIGFSGAPGHQKRRNQNNGSYDARLRTLHGLDPVTHAGREWDKLLQEGYRVLGARAPSDFHNASIDFWPCEFSSTHVFARSNSHNDVLQALVNGRAWAQLGGFVKHLNFVLASDGREYHAGQTLPSEFANKGTIKFAIELSERDWQGFQSSLDELSLIIASDSEINTVDLMPMIQKTKVNKFKLEYSLPPSNKIKAVRIMGRSIQAELHHYKVFTNPIFFE